LAISLSYITPTRNDNNVTISQRAASQVGDAMRELVSEFPQEERRPHEARGGAEAAGEEETAGAADVRAVGSVVTLQVWATPKETPHRPNTTSCHGL
jgi:molybdopterin converting factor small subunit